jgi:hypothetical protein
VEGVGEELVNIPIFAECIVPEVVVLTPVIDYARCFLEYPYTKVSCRRVLLINNADIFVF